MRCNLCAYAVVNTFLAARMCPRHVRATDLDFLRVENLVKLNQASPVALVELLNMSDGVNQLGMMDNASHQYYKLISTLTFAWSISMGDSSPPPSAATAASLPSSSAISSGSLILNFFI